MRQRRKSGTSRPKQLGIIVAGVGLVGAGGWFAGSQMQSPADAAAAHRPPKAGPVTVAVERRSLTASVVTQGSVEFASPQSLALAGPVGPPDSGSGGSGSTGEVVQRVTKAPAAGSEVKEGDVLMQVSGRPVLVLRGSVPMYRTLGPGASGDDVKQLEKALARLGFNPGGTSGTYGQSDAAAVVSWYRSKGFHAQEPSVADQQQLGTLEAAVTTAQQGLLEAQQGGGAGGTGSTGEAGKLQLKAARQQLDAANSALSAFQSSYGTRIPAGEVVFLPDLPARLDKVSVKIGDTPSGPVGTVTSSKVVVQAVVPGSDAKLLHKGMTAQVETPDGKKVTGELVALGDDVPKNDSGDGKDGSGSSDAEGGGGGGGGDASAPVPVQISIPSGELDKNANGSAKVTIKVGSSQGQVLTVPLAALHTSADGQAKVQVARGSTVVDVPVKAGLSAEGQVEVTPTGDALRVGDQVVIGR
ncbi:peptidoglycan-binding protein [Actinacidiphila glaucinigra]|uniref:peptidoglycan-binding domain-containing protein n=1 Tax=Actinacidiphila glaucinigra TaxID=235986 RepID=UPI002DD85A80|nr:peptidoglycan-binding domain-containing protein [Actinacidiphila glaucinigra]WSD57776.1 peptidoglycan-binding protein [Actinacidiphila glaucinigra]